MDRLLLPLLLLAVLPSFSCSGSRDSEADVETAASKAASTACADMAAVDHGLAQTVLSRAEEVAPGALELPGGAEAPEGLPALCRVAGTIEPAIRFEVWLPLEGWNGKYQGVGNGGMAGSVSYGALANAVRRGFAAASTDTGHASSGVPFDASWASGRPDLVADFGHRSLHLTTAAGKRLTELFYGREPSYSYYVGCSKGGQQGLMEAQRYPEDFDGILAGNPANDWTRFYAGAHLWYSLALLRDEASWIPPAKVQLLGDAVNEACDALDGVEDGVLDDPRRCDFDPVELQCEGAAGDDCLTANQVQAVRDIWSGAREADGDVIFPGLVPGGEASPGGWGRWVTGSEPFRSLHWLAGEGFFRHIVFDDPDWDFRTFDFDRDLPVALEKVGEQLDSADPDLRPLRDAGGKLIVYHGWSDPDISPLGSIDYYEEVADLLAREEGAADPPHGHPGVLPAVHGAGHGPLSRRSGGRLVRRIERARELGRGRRGAADHSGRESARRCHRDEPSPVPLPSARQLPRARGIRRTPRAFAAWHRPRSTSRLRAPRRSTRRTRPSLAPLTPSTTCTASPSSRARSVAGSKSGHSGRPSPLGSPVVAKLIQ